MESLKLYANPRILAIGLLGFASGLPLALVLSTLSVWLTEEGVSKTAIGLFAAITTPYALKFLWSPLVDQLQLPFFTSFLGKRRGWMVFSQICLAISIFALGTTDPSSNAWFTALFAFIVAACSSTQDIVIDAYRVEYLDEDQQGAGAAMSVFGYRIGMLASGAGALFLASYTSWFVTYAIMSTLVLVGFITVMIAGEPSRTEEFNRDTKIVEPFLIRFEKWIVNAVIEPFSDIMGRDGWVAILCFIVLYKFGDAFAGVMTNPFLIEIGFSKQEIASVVKLFGLGATLIGGFIGGWMISRLGSISSLWICGILQMVSNLMFVAQTQVGYNVPFLALTISVENLSGGMGSVAFVAYISSLCNVRYTATQYALFSSLAAVGRTWLSSSAGLVVDGMGWMWFFIISTVIAVPGLIVLRYLQTAKRGG